jgi:hypothetical protein
VKRISVFVGLLTSLVVVASASAAPGLKLDKQGISAKQCDGKGTHKVVDVHYTLINDADSGFAGNTWANDTVQRQLGIWKQADGSFCAQIADHGKFVTYAGASPGGTSTVPAGVKGDIDGGYITSNIQGSFDSSKPAHGDLGTFDLMCDQAGNCPGSAVSWKSYFTSVTSADEFSQWGWIYRAGKNGTWLNQDDVAAADSGDISG